MERKCRPNPIENTPRYKSHKTRRSNGDSLRVNRCEYRCVLSVQAIVDSGNFEYLGNNIAFGVASNTAEH